MPTLVLQGVGTRAATTLVLRRLYAIAGVTKAVGGGALGHVAVLVFRTATDVRVDRQISDPTTGTYTGVVYDRSNYYVVATTLYTGDSTFYTADQSTPTADTTEFEGATVNTLVGS